MENEVLQLIKNKNLINANETIGVAVSGGIDSMCLLHFLFNKSKELNCKIVAITIDHLLRGENSMGDALFVKNWCNKNNIECYKYSVDAGKLAKEKGLSIEDSARQVRFNVFEKLIEEKVVDKIALAHHMSDQAETILLHILRGSGLNGASGMDYIRDNKYIRPFLNITKDDIKTYATINNIENIEDETNNESKYNRNFLRNIVLPMLKKRWEGVEQNLVNFGLSCREDNDYILSQVSHNSIISENNVVKIPLIYFHYNTSVINRIIFKALQDLNANKDIERKHIDLIKDLISANNGKKINLPNNLIVQKEYDYITIFKSEENIIFDAVPFQKGKINFANLKTINVKSTKDLQLKEGFLLVDQSKIPENAVWRTRKNGDSFTKFGGGTKSLKNYFIDKKIPSRVRDITPILAVENEVLVILDVEISDKVKVTEQTKSAYLISSKDIKPSKK